jgi:hypothetical protein
VGVAIVDGLEPVEVDEEDTEGGATEAGFIQHLLAHRCQPTAVVQSGQLVEGGKPLQRLCLLDQQRRLLLDALLGLLALGDVARDAKNADNSAVEIAQRHLRRRHPRAAAVRPRFLFLDPHQRLACAHEPLLIRERLLRVFLAEEVEVASPDRLSRLSHPQPTSKRTTYPDEAALRVLEIDMVGSVLEQRVQQVAVVDQLFRAAPQRHDISCRINACGLGLRTIVHPRKDRHIVHGPLAVAPALRTPGGLSRGARFPWSEMRPRGYVRLVRDACGLVSL